MPINNPIKKKKFVTGATGYVGQHLVNSLIEKGYQVYILTRKESLVFSNNENINIIIGLKAHILRPTTIFGPGKNREGNSFLELIKSMRSGAYKNIGQGIYNIVHVDEVVEAMIQLSEANIPYGQIYLLNNPIAFKDIDILVKSLPPAITKKTRAFPYPVAWFATLILTLICFITRRKNPLTFSRLKALTNTTAYSQNKIMEVIHFKNTLGVEEYIKKVCLELFM